MYKPDFSLSSFSTLRSSLFVALAVAALLWFWMFSPWTAGITNFWITMAVAGVSLTTMALLFSPEVRTGVRTLFRRYTLHALLGQLLLGVALAALMWGIFWVGDKLSTLWFSFARPQVDSIYAMKHGLPSAVIALLLLFVIGPAEELFWRGYVQRTLAAHVGVDGAFVLTAAVYTLVHVWSMNFMLIMAALVAGGVWGLLYRLRPSLLPALIVSHAIWDACVFVAFPI